MEATTLNLVNNILQKEAGYRLSVNPLVDALHHKLAEEQDGVHQVRKNDNSGSKPSSNTSDGMEDKNEGYGKTTDTLEDDPSKDGAAETGKTQVSISGANYTHESSGMKDLSINQHKSASLDFLRKTSPTNKNRLAAALRGQRR
jgi:hypothetical protein